MPKARQSVGKTASLLRDFRQRLIAKVTAIRSYVTRAGGYKDCVSVCTFLPRTLEGDEAELTRVANPPPLSALD
jgi:hypothetical protein